MAVLKRRNMKFADSIRTSVISFTIIIIKEEIFWKLFSKHSKKSSINNFSFSKFYDYNYLIKVKLSLTNLIY